MKNGPYELIVPPKDYPGKKYRDRYSYEHHVVWWKNTEAVLKEDEIIHHINGDKRDNRFENLELMTILEHAIHHGSQKIQSKVSLTCSRCKIQFEVPKRNVTWKFKTGQVNFFCGRTCQVKFQWETGVHDNLKKTFPGG